jgi:hypothetical protein
MGVAKSKSNTKEQIQMTPKYTTEATDMRASEPLAYEPSPPLIEREASRPATRDFWQSMALHPPMVGTAIVTDCMCSAVDVASLGITAPFLWLIAGLFNGVIVFLGQRKWAGDDVESAFIKALIVAFLVALPTPFPAFLTVPSGIVGMVQALRRKS